MAALTESVMRNIARLQREEGVRCLSAHFSWPELPGDVTRMRTLAHQQFVFDTAVFAAERGVSWTGVIGVAGMAKRLFPELTGLDTPRLQSLLSDRLSECLPRPTPAHQRAALFHFLCDTCVSKQRLFQEVVGGASNLSVTQAHLEVQVPPEPLPLVQGSDACVWELQRAHARLNAIQRQKEAELRCLREGSEVTEEELDIPQEGRADREAVLDLARAAARARGEQLLDRLLREKRLVFDLLELRLQHLSLATGGPDPQPGLTRP